MHVLDKIVIVLGWLSLAGWSEVCRKGVGGKILQTIKKLKTRADHLLLIPRNRPQHDKLKQHKMKRQSIIFLSQLDYFYH